MTEKTDPELKIVAEKAAIVESKGLPTGERRRHLDERLTILHQRAMMIETQLKELDDNRFYRVCIFGSARIKPEMREYQEVFDLARMLASEGVDILTGGGPGLMEAANKGAKLGQQEKASRSKSFGLSIELDFEPVPNKHLDIKRHHYKFSSRLDDFMRLSHSIVATPGGIGTLLEVFFAWQLIQVRHMTVRPLVLMDKTYWTGVVEWMKEVPLKRELMGEKDFSCISIVDSPVEAYENIINHYRSIKAKGEVQEKP